MGRHRLAGRLRGLVPVGADLQAVAGRDAGHLDARPEGDPLGRQAGLDALGDLGVLAGEDMLGVGQDRDLRPQPGEGLRELHAGRPGADDGQRGGALGEVPDRRVVVVARLGQAGDVGDHRARARRDHELLPRDPRRAVDQDGVIRLECGRALVDVDPLVAQRAARTAPGELGHHRADPRHHGVEIDVDVAHPDAQRIRRPDPVGEAGGLDQRLARHAGGVRTLAPQAILLDQRDLGSHPRGRRCHAQAPGPSAQHHKVVHRLLSRMSGHGSAISGRRSDAVSGPFASGQWPVGKRQYTLCPEH